MQYGCVRLWKILFLKKFHVGLECVAAGDETCEFEVKPRI
jgi:predicted hydrocarbon binding protein